MKRRPAWSSLPPLIVSEATKRKEAARAVGRIASFLYIDLNPEHEVRCQLHHVKTIDVAVSSNREILTIGLLHLADSDVTYRAVTLMRFVNHQAHSKPRVAKKHLVTKVLATLTNPRPRHQVLGTLVLRRTDRPYVIVQCHVFRSGEQHLPRLSPRTVAE